ncbi:MAG: hypothetical protein AAFQ82_02825, partial [Myxococcota bacterium]
TRENLDRAQAIMNSADIDAQAAIVAHAMGAAGSRYELRPGFDNRTPMETWTTPSLCRDIHTAGAQMLEAAGWRTAAVGYQDAGHSHQNLLAVAPDGRVFMMEYGRLTEYPAGTEPLDVLQSFNVDAPEFYFYNAPDSPDDVANVSASVRTAIGLQVDSALLGRGVILSEPGVGVGQDGLGNTTVRFQATDSIAVDAIHLDGHAEGLGVMGRYSNGNESYGVGVFRFQGLRESSIGRREITESDQTALALSFSGHGSFYESTVASLSGGASVRFVSPYDTATTLLYFPESRELTAGMTQVRAGVTPQLSYSHPAGYWATGGMNLELGKATALAAYEGASLSELPYRAALTGAAGYENDVWALGTHIEHNLRAPMDERRQTSIGVFGAWDATQAFGVHEHGAHLALEAGALFESGESAFSWVDEDSVDARVYAGARYTVGALKANIGATHDLDDELQVSFGLSATPEQWGQSIGETVDRLRGTLGGY